MKPPKSQEQSHLCKQWWMTSKSFCQHTYPNCFDGIQRMLHPPQWMTDSLSREQPVWFYPVHRWNSQPEESTSVWELTCHLLWWSAPFPPHSLFKPISIEPCLCPVNQNCLFNMGRADVWVKREAASVERSFSNLLLSQSSVERPLHSFSAIPLHGADLSEV